MSIQSKCPVQLMQSEIFDKEAQQDQPDNEKEEKSNRKSNINSESLIQINRNLNEKNYLKHIG